MSAPGSAAPDPKLSEALNWLFTEPAGDCFTDLADLCKYFLAFPGTNLDEDQLQDCYEQFAGRSLDIVERFQPLLLDAALPLSRDLYGEVRKLINILLDISGAFVQLIDVAGHSEMRQQIDRLPMLIGIALKLVGSAFILSSMSGSSAPAGLWLRVSSLALTAAQRDTMKNQIMLPDNVALHYKRMLLVASMRPESLTSREILWAYNYLGSHVGLVELSYEQMQPKRSLFWINPAQDAAPVSYIRTQPAIDIPVLHFQVVSLLREISTKISWLEQRIHDVELVGETNDSEVLDSKTSDLPFGLMPHEALLLLRRIRDYWRAPPSREYPRRSHTYSVQVCHGLLAIWSKLHHSPNDEKNVTQWTLCNEGPSGYAISSKNIAGIEGELSAGMALALRRDARHPWSICVVRRICSNGPGEVELGLQLIARDCLPVNIGFRGVARTVSPALYLSPLPQLRHNQAILAPAGTYTARRFVLVQEQAHLYVTQGRVLSLDMQTPDLELFQYAVDPYPI